MSNDVLLMQKVIEVFEEDGLKLVHDAERVVRVRVREGGCRFEVIVYVDDLSPLMLHFIVKLPFMCPQKRTQEMMGLVCRLNERLRLGNFTLDEENGDIGFKLALLIAASTVTAEQIRAALVFAFEPCADFARVFCRLMYDPDLTAAAALAEFEMAEKD